MTDTAVMEPSEDALFERVRLLLFSADLLAHRLKDAIDDIGRYTAPDGRSSHLRLVQAMPPLKTAAETIVLLHAKALHIAASQRRPS
jgi:hypothetical protein